MFLFRFLVQVVQSIYRFLYAAEVRSEFGTMLKVTYMNHIVNTSPSFVLKRRMVDLQSSHTTLLSSIDDLVHQITRQCRNRHITSKSTQQLDDTMKFILQYRDDIHDTSTEQASYRLELEKFIRDCRRVWYDHALVWLRDHLVLFPDIEMLELSAMIEHEADYQKTQSMRIQLESYTNKIHDTLSAISLLKALYHLHFVSTLYASQNTQHHQDLPQLLDDIYRDLPDMDNAKKYNHVYGSLHIHIQTLYRDLKQSMVRVQENDTQ